MKYSIILPYFEKRMIHNTLVSFAHHYANRSDYEVIIIEDYKNVDEEHEILMRIIQEHKDYVPIRHIEVGVEFKDYYASPPLINLGVQKAYGKFIVLTSPECFHKTNVLSGFDTVLDEDPDAYVIASVANGDFHGEIHKDIQKFADFEFTLIRWYQHSKYCNRKLHFCSAMSKKIYNRVGGMDEGFAYGFWCDDEDFRDNVLREKIHIVVRDDVIAVHQRHPLSSAHKREELIRINQEYEKKKIGYIRYPGRT